MLRLGTQQAIYQVTRRGGVPVLYDLGRSPSGPKAPFDHATQWYCDGGTFAVDQHLFQKTGLGAEIRWRQPLPPYEYHVMAIGARKVVGSGRDAFVRPVGQADREAVQGPPPGRDRALQARVLLDAQLRVVPAGPATGFDRPGPALLQGHAKPAGALARIFRFRSEKTRAPHAGRNDFAGNAGGRLGLEQRARSLAKTSASARIGAAQMTGLDDDRSAG